MNASKAWELEVRVEPYTAPATTIAPAAARITPATLPEALSLLRSAGYGLSWLAEVRLEAGASAMPLFLVGYPG